MKALWNFLESTKFREPKEEINPDHPRNSNFRTKLPKDFNTIQIGGNINSFLRKTVRKQFENIYGKRKFTLNLRQVQKALKNRELLKDMKM